MIGKKNGKIEFLRFVFSVIIVLHHSRFFLGDALCPFLGGSLSVEFFFIVSGFLMMQSVVKKQSVQFIPPKNTLGQETRNFIFKKISAVYPEAIIAWAVSFCVISYSVSDTMVECVKRFMLGSYEVIFVDMFGIGSGKTNGVTWYISSMVLCMAILYPMLRKFPDFSRNVFIPFTMLMAYGYLFQNFSDPRNPPVWLGITFKGNIRAYADICMGVLAFELCKTIKQINWNQFGRFLITVAECGIYLFLIWYMQSQKANDMDYFCILILAAAVALTFSGLSLDLKFFGNPVVSFLGRFSLPLYLSHTFYSKDYCFIFRGCDSNREKMCLYLLATAATSAVVMIVSSWIRRHKSCLHGKIKHLIIEADHI